MLMAHFVLMMMYYFLSGAPRGSEGSSGVSRCDGAEGISPWIRFQRQHLSAFPSVLWSRLAHLPSGPSAYAQDGKEAIYSVQRRGECCLESVCQSVELIINCGLQYLELVHSTKKRKGQRSRRGRERKVAIPQPSPKEHTCAKPRDSRLRQVRDSV